jgi:hypothetical protein
MDFYKRIVSVFKSEIKDFYFGAIVASTALFLLISILKGTFYKETFILQIVFYVVYFALYKPIRDRRNRKNESK